MLRKHEGDSEKLMNNVLAGNFQIDGTMLWSSSEYLWEKVQISNIILMGVAEEVNNFSSLTRIYIKFCILLRTNDTC